MIRFENVTKKYWDNTLALEDVTLKIDPGEFVFLVGPSGSGKTTLLKMLTREELPTSGDIFINEYSIVSLKNKFIPKLRRDVSVVFQDFKLLPTKNVFENVAIALELSNKKDHEIKELVPIILKKVGLESKANHFPAELSGGEKQRIAIARALVHNPVVLAADEPTGMIDPVAAWEIMQLLSEINAEGTTVIVSTHNVDIVNSFKKRVIELKNGKIIRDETKGKYHPHG
ncbi:MAG: cell division ATP-binding protein FtsE [candidate division WWE3 bacterium]|nr:cell division ATP-binding protein FtsE [candidate division WWE3 bacterium]